jgi:hypothetical protein
MKILGGETVKSTVSLLLGAYKSFFTRKRRITFKGDSTVSIDML